MFGFFKGNNRCLKWIKNTINKYEDLLTNSLPKIKNC